MSAEKTAVVAFVPVIHKGYVDFFASHVGDIYFFGDDIVKQFVHLTRDLRVMGEKNTLEALKAVLPGRNVQALTEKSLKTWNYSLTMMPDDEVCHETATKYLADKKVEFVSVFLRWNRVITFKENEIDPKRKITKEAFHREVMAVALKEAQQSDDWWRQIAAVLIKEGKPILQTHNHHLPSDFNLSTNGDPRSNFDAGQHQDVYTSIHAEAELIAKAAHEGVNLTGASLYSTTFPCPNCARLIGTAGIKHVYYSKGYSLLDAEKILEHFGVEIVLIQ